MLTGWLAAGGTTQGTCLRSGRKRPAWGDAPASGSLVQRRRVAGGDAAWLRPCAPGPHSPASVPPPVSGPRWVAPRRSAAQPGTMPRPQCSWRNVANPWYMQWPKALQAIARHQQQDLDTRNSQNTVRRGDIGNHLPPAPSPAADPKSELAELPRRCGGASARPRLPPLQPLPPLRTPPVALGAALRARGSSGGASRSISFSSVSSPWILKGVLYRTPPHRHSQRDTS